MVSDLGQVFNVDTSEALGGFGLFALRDIANYTLNEQDISLIVFDT